MHTLADVNAELAPLVRMTAPAAYLDRPLEDAPRGVRLFRSHCLLFGLIPVDWDDLCLLSVEPERGFVEASSMATQRVWRHRRALVDHGDGACTLTDHLAMEPRIVALGPAFRAAFSQVFAHRHRRLRARFGGVALRTSDA